MTRTHSLPKLLAWAPLILVLAGYVIFEAGHEQDNVGVIMISLWGLGLVVALAVWISLYRSRELTWQYYLLLSVPLILGSIVTSVWSAIYVEITCSALVLAGYIVAAVLTTGRKRKRR